MPFVLGQALYMRAIHGGNAKNDRLAAHKIAALLRGGLLPHADVYPRQMRATRDLWRRRNHLMRKRAERYAHLQHTASQSHRSEPWGRLAKPQNRRGRIARVDHGGVQQNMAVDTALIDFDDPLLAALERSIEKTAHRQDPVSLALLRTIAGVGNLLALGLRYASEDSARFPRGHEVVADGRLVKSAKDSHGQRYGPSGKKIGNAHLQWAFSAAAVLFLKHNDPAPKYLAKLATRHGQGKALSIRAHNLGRAVYCRRKHHVAFDQETCLATSGRRERTRLASHGSHGGRGTSPSHRTQRSCPWDVSPHQRCLCRTAVPASSRVDWRAVPLLELSAPRTPAWLTGLPLPRARHYLDGRRACRVSGVAWDGTRGQQCVQVASGKAPGAAAAHCGRLDPR